MKGIDVGGGKGLKGVSALGGMMGVDEGLWCCFLVRGV